MEHCSKAITPPVLLVGSKRDLVENGENRQVSVAEAEQSLSRWRDMFRNSDVRLGPFLYMETSARVRVGGPPFAVMMDPPSPRVSKLTTAINPPNFIDWGEC